MKYRDIIGFSKKKKKVVKEKAKPKRNMIIEDIKKDLNEWNDTTFRNKPKRWSNSKGLTEFEQQGGKDFVNETIPVFPKEIKAVDKAYHEYWDRVRDLADALHDKGQKKEGNELFKTYMKSVHKFHKYFVKFIRKLS